MIQENELRIGNLIYSKFDDEIHVVYGIMGHHPASDEETLDSSVCIEGSWLGLKNCIPIPLTEEWLVKLGWKCKSFKSEYNRHYSIEKYPDEIEMHFMIEKGEFEMSIEWGEGWFPHPLKYVHQLQNLYFAVTGEELNLLNHAPITENKTP